MLLRGGTIDRNGDGLGALPHHRISKVLRGSFCWRERRTQNPQPLAVELHICAAQYNGSFRDSERQAGTVKHTAKINKATIKDIEKKFSDTAFRLNQERNDFFLPQVQDFVRQRKWINLRPEYQRRLVWDDEKRSLFLESLLLNVPVPPVFLYEWDLSRYEVMDGQQRLNSIVDFYENLYALRGLEKWSELNGSRYKELPETLQRGLDRRRISATVLLVGSTTDGGPDKSEVRKLVFERLNTGGQHLNGQELRNCLYAGLFNDLLIKLSQGSIFTQIWGIPAYDQNVDRHGNLSKGLRENPLYRRMIDCELVLRFFAFRKRTNIRGSVRSMLDRCMEDHLNDKEPDVETLSKDFTERIELAREVFGANTFRYQDETGDWRLSHPLYDGIMVALDRTWTKRKNLISAKAKVAQKVTELIKNESAFEVIVGKPNTAKAVLRRMELLTKAIESAL